jgi:hypothetical protein
MSAASGSQLKAALLKQSAQMQEEFQYRDLWTLSDKHKKQIARQCRDPRRSRQIRMQ